MKNDTKEETSYTITESRGFVLAWMGARWNFKIYSFGLQMERDSYYTNKEMMFEINVHVSRAAVV